MRGKTYSAGRKDEALAYARKYRSLNRDRMHQYRLQWDAQNKDRLKAYRAKWFRNNREKAFQTTLRWRARNQERVATVHAAYRRRFPERIKRQNAIRVASRRAAGGRLTESDIQDLLRLQRARCAACKKNIKSTYTIDHIVPVSKGGPTSRSNTQLLCRSCNCSKRDRDPEDFMRKRGFLL